MNDSFKFKRRRFGFKSLKVTRRYKSRDKAIMQIRRMSHAEPRMLVTDGIEISWGQIK